MKFHPHRIGHCAFNSNTARTSRIGVAFSLLSILHLASQHALQALPAQSGRQTLALASVRTMFEWTTCVHIGLWGYAPMIGGLGTILLMSLDHVAMKLAYIALLILLFGGFVGVAALQRARQRTSYWQEQAQAFVNQLTENQALAQQVAALQQQREDDMCRELESLRLAQQEMMGAHMVLRLSDSDQEILAEKRKIPPHELPHFMQFVKGLTCQYDCTHVSAEVIPFPGRQPTKKTGQV